MKRIMTSLLFSLGITFALFHLITLRTDIAFEDGAPLSAYGFPFPYVQFSQASSLDYNLNYAHLAMDFALYFVIVTAFVSIKRVYALLTQRTWVSAVLITGLACVPLAHMGVSSYSSSHTIAKSGRVTGHTLHIGYDRPYHPPHHYTRP